MILKQKPIGQSTLQTRKKCIRNTEHKDKKTREYKVFEPIHLKQSNSKQQDSKAVDCEMLNPEQHCSMIWIFVHSATYDKSVHSSVLIEKIWINCACTVMLWTSDLRVSSLRLKRQNCVALGAKWHCHSYFQQPNFWKTENIVNPKAVQ